MHAWAVVLAAAVLAGCGSSATNGGSLGAICDGGGQCASNTTCVLARDVDDPYGTCTQSCSADGGGCPAGQYCKYVGEPISLDSLNACDALVAGGAQCTTDIECASGDCVDGGVRINVGWYSLCAPPDGGPLIANDYSCLADSWCASQNCADAGGDIPFCAPDAGP